MKKEKFYKKISIAIMFLAIMGSFLLFFDMNKIQIYDQIENITKGSVNEYSLVETTIYSCNIEEPTEKTVILRIDDIAPNNNQKLMESLVKDITSRGYGVTLGVIPSRLEKSKEIIRWLQKINENPLVELSQHGYEHTENEFKTLSYEEAKEKINLGRNIMVKYFGELPLNFIPPYNVDSDGTLKALKELGFKTLSGSVNEFKVNKDFAMVGYTATTYYYSEDRFAYAEEVLEKCGVDLDKNGVCVIMFHPQDFTDNGKVDEVKYAEYIKVLDGLKELNADVVNFRQAFCQEY